MFFFIKTIVAWRKFIVVTTLVAAVVVAGISLILPKWFTAASSIFPPEKSSTVPIYAELLQSMQMPLLGPMGTGARPETIYIDMMKSRRIGEQLVEEFDLMEIYEADLMEDALDELHSHTRFTLLENGIIVVGFEDRNPERAAAVANRYVSLLDEFNRELTVTRASKTREFIERQLGEREATLAEAELELKNFQDANEALELGEQLSAAMAIVTDLTADAIALQTELKILEHYASRSSDEYLQKRRQYDEVVAQLRKLKLEDAESESDLLHAYLPTLEEIPELALELLRRQRTVQIETSVYTMLLKEYEKSRIEEARDTPTVQIMDRAVVPSLRSRPKRKMLVIVGAMAGFGWSVFLSVLVTVWRENKTRSGVITEVFNPVLADFSRIFRRR